MSRKKNKVSDIVLTEGQSQLIDKIMKWYKDFNNGTTSEYEHPQYFVYSGAAGVGKTRVIKEIISALRIQNHYVGCAYTGKAVQNIQKNGLKAKTIHSLIYNIYLERVKNERGRFVEIPVFELKEELDEDYKLIFVDEASMVNDDLAFEILSFGKPVIFLGDMNQLPSIYGSSNIMKKPDFVLTQIVRQSEDNPIIMLSQMIMKGMPILEGDYGNCKVVRRYEIGPDVLNDFDQIICVTNKIREQINQTCRVFRYGPKNIQKPHLLDKIVCRQNNWDIEANGYFLTNGTTGILTNIDSSDVAKGYYTIDFHPDYFPQNIDFEKLQVDAEYINADFTARKYMGRTPNEKFEYAYALTVYLSQGSEYNRVLYIDDWFHDAKLTQKSRYTAITRAKESITIVLR